MKTNTLNKDEHNGMEIKICKTCKKKLGMFAKDFNMVYCNENCRRNFKC